ncbi:MAG: hypothetical protein ACFFCZ_07640 [Promethearchaeota archaeon]
MRTLYHDLLCTTIYRQKRVFGALLGLIANEAVDTTCSFLERHIAPRNWEWFLFWPIARVVPNWRYSRVWYRQRPDILESSGVPALLGINFSLRARSMASPQLEGCLLLYIVC